MLEIVSKNDSGGGCDFAQKMVELQTKTTIKIIDLACEHQLDPFEVLKFFGTQIIQSAADMRAHFKENHGDESDETET